MWIYKNSYSKKWCFNDDRRFIFLPKMRSKNGNKIFWLGRKKMKIYLKILTLGLFSSLLFGANLPLFLISIYVLIDSFKLQKNYVQTTWPLPSFRTQVRNYVQIAVCWRGRLCLFERTNQVHLGKLECANRQVEWSGLYWSWKGICRKTNPHRMQNYRSRHKSLRKICWILKRISEFITRK